VENKQGGGRTNGVFWLKSPMSIRSKSALKHDQRMENNNQSHPRGYWRNLMHEIHGTDLILDQSHPLGYWRNLMHEIHGIELAQRP